VTVVTAAVRVEVIKAVPLHVVPHGQDFVENVAAVGSVIAAAVAIVALLVAIQSALSSSKSASAATESLTILRAEAKAAAEIRDRRAAPVLNVTAESRGTSPDGPPALVILRLGFHNEGTRAAALVNVNFLIPEPLIVVTCDRDGAPTDDAGKIEWTGEVLGDVPPALNTGSSYWDGRVDNLSARGALYKLQHLCIRKPRSGTFLLKGVLIQEDIPPDGWRADYWRLTIPANGSTDDVVVSPVDEPPASPADPPSTRS
jgi:hypothetical protein